MIRLRGPIVITVYQESIRWLGNDDPTTRGLLAAIHAGAEEHAGGIVELPGV